MIKPFLVSLLCTLLATTYSLTQELDCEITIDQQSLTGITSEARENLINFAQQVKQYMNSTHWTKENLSGERIKCILQVTFLGAQNDNHYSAKAFIGSQRPIYKSDRNTALARILDDKWEFDYIRNQSFIHDETHFDPLLSFLDFYANVIIGYDFASGDFGFSKPGGGAPYLQKATEIINRARNVGGAGKGWEISSRGTYSRVQLIEELLNPKYNDFREVVLQYHYRGLDLLYKDPVKARKNMLSALEKLGNLQDKINQASLIIRLFFEAKYLEIAQQFLEDADPSIYQKLVKIDRSHQSTYDEYSKKRK